MAKLPENIRRVGGELVSARQPFGRRVLLPTEADLCNLLGITEEEYWQFVEQVAAKSKERPAAYDLIPDIQAGAAAGAFALYKTVAGVTTLTWLGQVAVGVALTAVGYLLDPKPKEEKAGGSQRTADAIGNKRFAPQSSFNSLQELAVLGSIVPLVFANRRIEAGISYGGIRVNSQLIWSQLLSLGKLQQLKAMALFSLGEVADEPDYKGYAIGDMLLDSYNSDKVALYFRDGSNSVKNRLESGDKYSESKLDNDKGIFGEDPFSVQLGVGASPVSSNHTSSARNPSTQTAFGLYAPMPNRNYYRLPYELLRETKDSKNEGKRALFRKRKKVAIAKWPIRAGIRKATDASKAVSVELSDGTVNANVGDLVEYQILAGSVYGRQSDLGGTDEKFNYDPHGVEDINTATISIRETIDGNIAKGESYMIGTSIAVCSAISRPSPWFVDDKNAKEYTFKITEAGGQYHGVIPKDINGSNNELALALHADNPQWVPDITDAHGKVIKKAPAFEANGKLVYHQQRGVLPDTENRELKDGYEVSLIQRLALGTITNSKNCSVTEIGIKSKVFKQISFANVNSKPTEDALNKAREDKTQLQLGRMDLFATRISFFQLQTRPVGSDEDWIDLGVDTKRDASQQSGLFAVKGNTNEFQYNTISIEHPDVGQYEYRFKPYPGNHVYKNYRDFEVNLLTASSLESDMKMLTVEYSTDKFFEVSFKGDNKYKLTAGILNNSHWHLGDPSINRVGGVERLDNEEGENYYIQGNNYKYTWELDPNYSQHYDGSRGSESLIYYSEWTKNNVKAWAWTLMWKGKILMTGYYGGTHPSAGDWLAGEGRWMEPGTGNKNIEFIYDDPVEGEHRYVATLRTTSAGHYAHPIDDSSRFYIDRYNKVTRTPTTFSNVSVAGGTGTGLTVDVNVLYEDTNNYYVEWTVKNSGQNYSNDETGLSFQVENAGDVSIPAFGGLTVKVARALDNNVVNEKNLNPWDVISDWTPYDGDRSSHQDGPEHEICFVNELVRSTGTSQATQYGDLAYAGIVLNSSKEWSNFTQLSAYFKKGIKVEPLVGGGPRRATNLFPEIAYALLTDANFGAGELIGSDSVELKDMVIAGRYCQQNRYFWDGTITEKINLREFLYKHAGYCLLDFTIIGGKFSLIPTLPYNTEYSINHAVNIVTDKKVIFNENAVPIGETNYIKTLFTDGNINDLKVSFLAPEERQMAKANVLYRKEKENGFPETVSILVTLKKEYDYASSLDFKDRDSTYDPVETFDLSGFCTSKKQASDFAKYVLKTRKEVDHGLTFKTAPQYTASLTPGDYFRLVSEATHTNRFKNGAITLEGKVVSIDDLTGNQPVYVWKPGTEDVESTNIDFDSQSSIDTHKGKLFTVRNTTINNRIYKVESLSYTEDGLIEVAGSHSPVNDSNQLIVLQGWEPTQNHFIIEEG